MAQNAISTGQLLVNNEVVTYVPNSFKMTEGFGEYNYRAATVGAGQSEAVFSDNAEMKYGQVKFELFPTADNIALARSWKANLAANVIEYVADGMQRTFTSAAIVNDYEIEVGADTTISLEFKSDPAS